LAIHLGLLRAGFAGLCVAGACFIFPAVLIILPLAYAYVRFGTLPPVAHAMAGINAAVVAVLAVACWRFGRSALKDRFTVGVALLAGAAALGARLKPIPQAELLILITAAAAGAVRAGALRRLGSGPAALPALLPPLVPLAAGAASTQPAGLTMTGMALFFLKVGATLFGSGYVLVSYLDAGLVAQRGWLTKPQLLDAVAVGQVTPGPLLTTATFVGYVLGHRAHGPAGGVAGALLATAAIFLPAFVFVAALGRILPRLSRSPVARGALDAASAAVVSLIVVVTLNLAAGALRTPTSVAVFAAAAVALLAFNVNATWVMLAAALVGLTSGFWF
jgi:chromate transporter